MLVIALVFYHCDFSRDLTTAETRFEYDRYETAPECDHLFRLSSSRIHLKRAFKMFIGPLTVDPRYLDISCVSIAASLNFFLAALPSL